MSDEKPPISKACLYMLMIFMLLFGAANTLVMKYMDDYIVGYTPNPDPEGEPIPIKFTHPYFQGAIMFFGEFTVLGAYFIKTRCFNKAS